jgi:membrane protein YqaA with SNARE-associated domain
MKIFSSIYQRMLTWSRDPKAPYFLASVSFMESSFFPIPPDVMLISMGMVKPKSVWQYAFITTFFSVLGGILGYVIGAYAITWILPMLKSVGYYDNYLNVQAYFRDYGIGFVIVAGFTPIPYKLFTIAAGTMNMALLPFIMASIIGRGMRFFLVATLMYYQGEKIEKKLTQHIEKLSWLIVSLFLLGYVVIKLWH